MKNKKPNKKRLKCYGCIIIIFIILVAVFTIPITQSRIDECLRYDLEIIINGSNEGTYIIIIPAPIDKNGNVMNEVNDPIIFSGDVEIELNSTPFGEGLKITSSMNSKLRFSYKNTEKNVDFDKTLNYDIDMFENKPVKSFENSNSRNNGSIWIYFNYSEKINNITLSLRFDHWKDYYKPHTILDETIFKTLPSHDNAVSFRYIMSSALYKDWDTYNITVKPICFL